MEDVYMVDQSFDYAPNADELGADNISITDGSSTMNSSVLQKKMNDVLKKESDRGYNRIKLSSNNKVDVYDTGASPGTTIRLASSGVRMRGHWVGSIMEDLYFKVVYTGIRYKTSKINNEALFLYYESPEQWERIFKTTCSEDVKANWKRKYNLALRKQMNKQM
jgi:hypothetical protein